MPIISIIFYLVKVVWSDCLPWKICIVRTREAFRTQSPVCMWIRKKIKAEKLDTLNKGPPSCRCGPGKVCTRFYFSQRTPDGYCTATTAPPDPVPPSNPWEHSYMYAGNRLPTGSSNGSARPEIEWRKNSRSPRILPSRGNLPGIYYLH